MESQLLIQVLDPPRQVPVKLPFALGGILAKCLKINPQTSDYWSARNLLWENIHPILLQVSLPACAELASHFYVSFFFYKIQYDL